LSLHQLDIKNVVLHSALEDKVYKKQPFRFIAQVESSLLCKMCHSLCGLQQSPRVWFKNFNHIIQSFKLKCREADHFVFFLSYLPWKICILDAARNISIKKNTYAIIFKPRSL